MPAFFAVSPRGVEDLLADELRMLGVAKPKNTAGGVAFESDWATAYRVLLYTRIASKLLHPLDTFVADSEQILYNRIAAFPWEDHFGLNDDFAIDAILKQAPIGHSQYAAQRFKDGVVDRFKKRTQARPNVNRTDPDIRLHLLWHREQATISIDLGGHSLHQRGYRKQPGSAPLKENLAAAILYRAGWPKLAAQGASLVDPFCGSGTFLIEGLLMAAGIAPGLLNPSLGVPAWSQFQTELWRDIRAKAREAAESGLQNLQCKFLGTDSDRGVLEAARNNADRAGVLSYIEFSQRKISQWQPSMTTTLAKGLVVANPPYGERMGDLPEAVGLFAAFGKVLRTCFLDWQAIVLTGDRSLGKHLALRAKKVNQIYNGPLLCSLLRFDIIPDRFAGAQSAQESGQKPTSMNPGAQMFANRLRKNQKQLAKWLRQQGHQCYRIYDADMPEYNVAVDIYADHALIGEYQAPKTIDPHQAEKRLHDVLRVVPEVLGIARDKVHLKLRQKQKGSAQYERLDEEDQILIVDENGLQFEVSLRGYLDTGLFLDHRDVRKRIGEMSEGRSFLNLFAYTGTATVYAAKGGASETVTVDMSATYIQWAESNLRRNGFYGRRHELVQADCLTWMSEQRRQFDLILLDPPTFSNSKRMHETLDIQRDHPALIKQVIRLLKPGGKLIFSNNARRFKLDEAALTDAGLQFEDWTKVTMPMDFQRNRLIHHCWLITRK